jgi:hypothetical protein
LTKLEYRHIIGKESAAVNAMQTAGLENSMARTPKNGTVYSVPQLGQMLFVEVDKGIQFNCGQVVSCRLFTDTCAGRHSICVSTSTFPEEFDIFLAPGIEDALRLYWPGDILPS